MKKKQESNNLSGLIWALALIIFMAFGLGLFLTRSAQPELIIEYSNGYEFIKSGNFWYTKMISREFNTEVNMDFRYAPSEVRDIPVEGDPTKFFTLLQINDLDSAYFTFNPLGNLTYMGLAAADLAKLMKVFNGVTLIAACTLNETTACQDRPIVTCESHNYKSMVIYAKLGKEPKITMENTCLTIEGSGTDLIRTYTKLLFLWYGILD